MNVLELHNRLEELMLRDPELKSYDVAVTSGEGFSLGHLKEARQTKIGADSVVVIIGDQVKASA